MLSVKIAGDKIENITKTLFGLTVLQQYQLHKNTAVKTNYDRC